MGVLSITAGGKTCPICGGPGPFSKDPTRKDGLSWACKECAKNRARQWREANLERSRASCADWRHTHPDKVRSRNKAWYQKHAEEERARSRSYAKAHKEKRRTLAHAKKASNKATVDALKEAPCVDCGSVYPSFCMDFDHLRDKRGKQLSHLYKCSVLTVLAELKKCDLVCANCHRVRTENRRTASPRNPKRRIFRDRLLLLKSHPCSDCGRILDPRVMEFDHARGEKTDNISSMYSYPWEEVLFEISKCDLICSVCHRKRTEARRT